MPIMNTELKQQIYAEWIVPKEEVIPVIRMNGRMDWLSRPLEDQIDRIIQNGNATIVMWKDTTKTVVKKAADEEYNLYAAVAQAVLKKLIGSTSRAHKIIKKKTVVQKPKEKKKTVVQKPKEKKIKEVEALPEEISYGGEINETND